MMTSRFMPLILLSRSSSLALPSGFRTDLSKSKNASAANVTLVLAGTGGGGGGGGVTAGGAGGGGATTGAWATFKAPSQVGSAVAGVQNASRQQSSLVPFFQVRPVVLTQLSTVLAWANADVPVVAPVAAIAAVAMSDATLFSFFIDSPLEEGR